MSSDSSVGLCLNCAGRDLQNVLFGKPGETSASDEPGLPGWKVQRLLGSGGMGQLWLVKSRDEMALLAVVKIPIEGAAEPDELAERFETEAELLSGLDHPNICLLYTSPSPRDS